jgi:hypothetical protein
MIRAWVRATNHSREWAVGQVLDVTPVQTEMAGSSEDQRG